METSGEHQPPRPPEPQSDFPIVGIGASAGGVQALHRLLQALPSDLGAAYVIIMHLDPGRQSELASILQAGTRMSVIQVQRTLPLQPDCVYVIPPNRQLVIADHQIGTAEFGEPRGRRTPIDHFFRSLADHHGSDIAIVLTGAGSDGAVGVRAVKEAGGIVIVQDPAEAEYASMPRSAIATGAADLILPVGEIATLLTRLIPATRRGSLQPLDEGKEGILRRIFAHVRAKTGHDFAHYKRSTMLRRIARRMQVNGIDKLEAYAGHLQDNAEEVQALLADLLISVTSFFRDRAAFEALATKAIPALFESRATADTIRAWVPGCATGEEAYSIAMLLLEEASKHDQRPELQVFASDIDAPAIAIAREGIYPKGIAADISDERLRRFFLEEGDQYRIRKEVREMVLFTVHNLLSDPPFSKLDLVSCRNFLIYLGRPLQQQALTTLHYALKPGGFLFLGASEGADRPPDLFEAVDQEARIYRARESTTAQWSIPRLALGPRLPGGPAGRPPIGPTPGEAAHHKLALEYAAPPTILLDEHFRITHLSESAGRYLQHPGGPLRNELTAIVRPELRLPLAALLHRALAGETPVLGLPIPVRFNGSPHEVVIQVRTVEGEGLQRRVLVFFLEGGAVTAEGGPDAGLVADNALVDQLRRELDLTRASLIAGREEFELTTEELRAANEELESVNEEYRSTAEELETSKEELQSINEELQTVNNELKLKLDAVARAHSDLQNLITATDVGTLFLDNELRIRRFTPRIIDVFNITAADEGRPITDFTHRLEYDGLAIEAKAVLERGVAVEHEVRSWSGRWYLLRLRPYRTGEDRVDGLGITLVDISERRQAEDALRDNQRRLLLASEAAELGIYELDPASGELWLDRRARELWGLKADQAATREARLAAVHPDDVDAVRAALDGALAPNSKAAYSIDFRTVGALGAERWVRAQAKVFRLDAGDAGRATRLIGTIQDITENVLAAHQRIQLSELSHRMKNTLAIVLAIARQSFRGLPAEQALATFAERMRALAATHAVLIESAWHGAELSTLIARHVGALIDRPARLELEGPSVILPENLATPVGLMLHELATNAIKHGAFANDRGRVALTWRVVEHDHQPNLELEWRERGGPPVTVPTAMGFGSYVIDMGVPGAEVERDFRPEGLVCRVRLPLSTTCQGQ